MKKLLTLGLISILGLAALAQTPADNKTLLWKISGNGLEKPSYLFGTIHMICNDGGLEISDSLKSAIRSADQVYLELDMDNMFELMSVVTKMKMNGDTTLADLLSPEEYRKVKDFFNTHTGLIPFAMLETYKPLLTASTLMQSTMECDNSISMEQLIMKDAKAKGKPVKGLETMAFQMSIFDSIPYMLQAKQLVQFVEDYDKKHDGKEFEELTQAYMTQDLEKLEKLTTKESEGMEAFTEILLYKRNETWVKKLSGIFPKGSYVVAVGAGHLPGDRGVISLLRKAGYTVEPVKNEMLKRFEKQL
ncbi:MAG TPA: TraB/GumN family protein [Chitinophagaceae bacterium]